MENLPDSTNTSSWKKILPPPTLLLTLYLGFVSGLYLLGYWGTFEINVFEYVSLAEVIKIALIYLFLVTVLLSAVTAEVFVLNLYWKPLVDFAKKLPLKRPTKAAASPAARYLLILAQMVFVIDLVFLFAPAPTTIPTLYHGILIALCMIVFLVYSQMVINGVPDQTIRFLLGFTVALPILAFSFGKTRAEEVKTAPRWIVSTDIFREKQQLRGSSLKYLGTAGEFVFFLGFDNKTVLISKYADLHFLRLQKEN